MLSFPQKGLLPKSRLLRRSAPRNDGKCVSVSCEHFVLLSIDSAKQSQTLNIRFGNKPLRGEDRCQPYCPGYNRPPEGAKKFFKSALDLPIDLWYKRRIAHLPVAKK